jgi:putative inorganic carbon (HCO3(-)) transporter
MKRFLTFLDSAIYWLIIMIPFSMAIAPAPLSVFMGQLLACFLLKKILKKEPLFVRTAIDLPLICIIVMTIISFINSVDYKDSLRGGVGRLMQYVFIFYILVQEIKDKLHIQRIIASVVLGIVLVSCDELWQVATGKDFVRGYATIVNLGLLRATASFKDANTLGVYLSALAPLVLGLAFFYYRGRKKIIMVLASALALAGIVLTYSRPTFLALYLVLLFFAITRRNRLLTGLLILLLAIGPFILPGAVKEWARVVDYNPVRFMCNDDRIAIYLHTFNMIKAHPVIGVGANTYMKNYKRYKIYPEYRGIGTSDFLYAHNNFLHLAAEIGLIGLGCFLWLLFNLFKELGKIYRSISEPYPKAVVLSLIACAIAFQINGLTESSLYSARVALLFWYIAGLGLAFKRGKLCR